MEEQELIELTGVNIEELIDILKSDTVYTALRFAFKSPSTSGVDNFDDSGNIELYKIVTELRK